MPHAYRLGFAVKVLGAPEPLKEADRRRWQSGPHLRHSIELLHGVWDHLARIGVRMYRMSSNVIPYGTHPDLPEFDYRRQLDECADALAELGARARSLDLRLSTHPGQYTVINGPDSDLRDRRWRSWSHTRRSWTPWARVPKPPSSFMSAACTETGPHRSIDGPPLGNF
ncbi:MAG TPA: hypothetical protein VFP30_05440 [Candidatus Limnocylindria bacterium]|nr:hypothetical protein [Candidatus Limnocylindria bacterium]